MRTGVPATTAARGRIGAIAGHGAMTGHATIEDPAATTAGHGATTARATTGQERPGPPTRGRVTTARMAVRPPKWPMQDRGAPDTPIAARVAMIGLIAVGRRVRIAARAATIGPRPPQT